MFKIFKNVLFSVCVKKL